MCLVGDMYMAAVVWFSSNKISPLEINYCQITKFNHIGKPTHDITWNNNIS